MSIVLNTQQREQAGSDSYNRFEYQAHWIVYHIINQLEKNPKCIVFCEFHDDMAQLAQGENSPFEFYQIKTKEENDEWTVAELSKKEKKKDGTYKKSFLGFIFYNFLKFGDECSCCHFVSNNTYDLDIRTWQCYIEDNNIEDIKYQEIIILLRKFINEYLLSEQADIHQDEITLQDQCFDEMRKQDLSSYSLDNSLIEVLYYEQKFRRSLKA